MEVNSEEFLDELKMEAEKIILKVIKIKHLSFEQLNFSDENSWNILECIEHMNLYHDYYIPEIRNAIQHSKFDRTFMFKKGWFGNYSAKVMLPKKEGEVNTPMSTFKDMNPKGKNLEITVIDKFLSQMEQLKQLIEEARKVNLRRTKVKLTIRILRFSLGDTLHFILNHNRRHLIQIQKLIQNQS